MSEELGIHSTHSSEQRKSIKWIQMAPITIQRFLLESKIAQALLLSMSTSPNFLAVSFKSL